MPPDADKEITRRQLLGKGAWGAGVLGLGAIVGAAARQAQGDNTVWQIDPLKCTACGNCATYCVLDPSAVKCVNDFALCGYCDLCTGYLATEYTDKDTAAENQICPTGAVVRKWVERQFYEYTIDEPLCIGCGKCVIGCALQNGSFFLQVRHDRCLNCSECAIAVACPADAFRRVPADQPYLIKSRLLDKEQES